MDTTYGAIELTFRCGEKTYPYLATYSVPQDRASADHYMRHNVGKWIGPPDGWMAVDHVVPCGKDAELVNLTFEYREWPEE